MNETILSWPDLEKSGNTKLAWLWLWHQAGQREGMIITSAAAIAAAIGTTDRAARRMIENLDRLGAMELLERDAAGAGRFRGQLRVYIRNPKTIHRSQPPGIRLDPQSSLIPEAIEPTIVPAHPAVSAPRWHDMMAPKPPDAGQTEPSNPPAAQRFAVDRRAINPATMAPKPPDPFNVSKEVENLSRSKHQGTTPLNALNNEGRFRAGCPEAHARPVSGDLAAAIDAAARYAKENDLPAQKRRLEEAILDATGETDPTWWVAGNGADLVLNHGYQVEELQLLLRKINVRRRLSPGAKAYIPKPQAYLQNALSKIAQKCGAQWGRQKAKTATGCEGSDYA